VTELHPELRVIPRIAPEHVEAMLEAGAEGAVVQFPDEAAMRDFARRHRSAGAKGSSSGSLRLT
jgi:hypothetical protein